MLKCKEVAEFASDFLDKNTGAKLSLKIRLHLLICANCRCFVKHLDVTKIVVAKIIERERPAVDAEAILKNIKARITP